MEEPADIYNQFINRKQIRILLRKLWHEMYTLHGSRSQKTLVIILNCNIRTPQVLQIDIINGVMVSLALVN